ncbi:MAG: hypothetical protein U5R31_13485 [Acidimicrobiia bacterium]|nr:hypothetical protein [Acidimicrobiia bacterium]
MTVAVTTTSAVMVLDDAPHASVGQLGLFVVTAIVVVIYAVSLYRPLVGRSEKERL